MYKVILYLFGILLLAKTILSFPQGKSQNYPFSCRWPYLRCPEPRQPSFEINKTLFPTLQRILPSIFTTNGKGFDKLANEQKVLTQNLTLEKPFPGSDSNINLTKNTENLQSVRTSPISTISDKNYDTSVNERKPSSENINSKITSSDAFFLEVIEETTAKPRGNEIVFVDDYQPKTNNFHVINIETPTDIDYNTVTSTEEQDDTTEESLYRISELSPAIVASLLGG